jgi:DNA-binding MarR family transcriptional regulator
MTGDAIAVGVTEGGATRRRYAFVAASTTGWVSSMAMTETVEAGGLARDDPRLEAWRTFLTAHARLNRRLDEELRAEHGLSLAEYDTLLQIAVSVGRSLRMHVLAERVLLSRSGTTRLIDRLVSNGLVERSACSSDARGAEAVLTGEGLDRLQAASRTHLRGIDSYFIGVIDPDDLAVVQRTLGDVAERVAGCSPGTPRDA